MKTGTRTGSSASVYVKEFDLNPVIMDSRDRHIYGAKGFDFHWWIFYLSFSIIPFEMVRKPKWFAKLMCILGKHDWRMDGDTFLDYSQFSCLKCGLRKK